jgi:hypothetical protein
VFGSAGDLIVDARGGAAGGGVFVETTGSLSLDSGGLQVAGQNGRGANLSFTAGGTLALNDTSAFADVDATGSNGNGGILILDGGDVIFQSSLSTPLVLSANGIGTGNGGSIRFSNGSAAATIIGSPAVGVWPDSNFLQISAVSGLSGGHGGNANITTGGALVVATSGLNVAPQSSTGNWEGGGLYISAERNLDKTGTVYIEGDLNVDGVGTGDGGFISIVASSKNDLVLGPTRGTVNGIFGSLSAMGGNGSISIRNNAGGILIDTSTTLNASEVQLAAGDRGNISSAKGAALTAPGSLKLSTTGTGDVGKKVLLVNAPVLSLSSLNGSVNVEDLHTSTVTLGFNSRAGKDFNLTTAGSLTVQQNLLVRTTAGDINLTAKTGTLFLDQNSHLEARKGAINILNEDTAQGDILIYPGSEIETNSKGRNITISIGKARKEREPVPPIFVVSTEGNGKAFFSTGVEAPTASLVNANNRSVIFYNGSTNPAKKIQVYDSTITADKN